MQNIRVIDGFTERYLWNRGWTNGVDLSLRKVNKREERKRYYLGWVARRRDRFNLFKTKNNLNMSVDRQKVGT